VRAARALLVQALEDPEPEACARVLTRACDRFALVTTGAPLASLAADPLPSVLRDPPALSTELLRASPRALDLVAFAARDNLWLARREHGL